MERANGWRQRRLGLLVTVLLLTCPAAGLRAGDWPMFGHDPGRTFASPEDLPDRLALRWSLRLPPLQPAWPDQPRVRTDAAYRPIVVGSLMIVASSHDDSVAAYDLADGREAWRFFTGGPVRYAPAAADGRVFVGSDDGYLYALGAGDGRLLWELKAAPKTRPVLGSGRVIDTWCVRGGPVADGGNVYFAAGLWPFMGVFVGCADAAAGKLVWCNSGDGSSFMIQPHGAPSFGGLAPQGALAVTRDRVLVPNGRAMPASLDRATGAFQYFQLNNKNGGDRVSAGRNWFFNDTQVFDPADGAAVSGIASAPVVLGDVAYSVGGGGDIRSYDVSAPPDASGSAPGGGEKKSKRKFPDRKTGLKGVRVLAGAGGRLYAGGDGWVAALGLPLKEGKAGPLWTLPIDGTAADVIAAGGCLIVTTEEGAIHCLGDAARNVATEPAAAPAAREVAPAAAVQQAEAILADGGTDSGYAVVLGAGGEDVARGLASAGGERLHVLVLEPDAAAADSLRRRLREDGLYGSRVAVVVGDVTGKSALPPYLANLVVAGGRHGEPGVEPSDQAVQGVYRLLHPYRGTAYLPGGWKQPLASLAAGATGGRAEVTAFGDGLRLARRNGLPGAGSWTHEHADAANTRVSGDTLAKAPLGVLWFGGSSHEGILPRHGHGPQPQVVGGRILILGMDMLRAMDAYTGRVLWEASMPGVGSYYDNTAHHPGANGTGSNFVSTTDAVYVALRDACVQLDPATGRTSRKFPLPPDLPGLADDWVWSYINLTGDYLVGGAAPPMAESVTGGKSKDDDDTKDTREPGNPRTVGSRVLFAMDRHTGKLLWARASAMGEFRHNAVCLGGGGRLFAIDRPPFTNSKKRFIPGGPDDQNTDARLMALDLSTGREHWAAGKGVFGTWLGYSAAHDVLIETGRSNRDSLGDEVRGMRAYKGTSGAVIWHDARARGPAMIRGETVMKDTGAAKLTTGEPVLVPDPITRVDREWGWARNYGCNTPAGSQHLLTFRSGAAGFYDLARNGGTGNFGGFRSSCTNNLIVADGLIAAPDYTRTCSCSYPLQTSLALVPDEDVEVWTFLGNDDKPGSAVRRLGVNLGAPGDRVDDAGTLWLEHPPTAGKSPQVGVTVAPEGAVYFRHHASTVTGPAPWVAASGVRGVRKVTLDLNGDDSAKRRYTVRLYLVSPAEPAGGEVVMDVSLQGIMVERGLDALASAGAPGRSLVREYAGIQAGKSLVIDLAPSGPRNETVLCGVEVVEETSDAPKPEGGNHPGAAASDRVR